MIEEFRLDDNKTLVKLSASEWRYSAAALGLIRYFDFLEMPFVEKEVKSFESDSVADVLDDQVIAVYEKDSGCEYLCFLKESLTEEKYLSFVREVFKEELLHCSVEEALKRSAFTEEELKEINGYLTGNTVMKKVFGKLKFDGTNHQEILKIINENQDLLTKESYRNKKNLYANYNNTNQLFNEAGESCRLLGYTIDMGKKGKSTGYNFNTKAIDKTDSLLFDYIPFAFTGDREVFFINANYSFKNLRNKNIFFANQVIENRHESDTLNARYTLFNMMIHSSELINADVEVIYKNRESDFFETLYIRKDSIRVLKAMKKFSYEAFCFSLKVTDDYYLNIQKMLTDCILNLLLTDELIDLFLKQNDGRDYRFLIGQLIEMNQLIREGGREMKDITRFRMVNAKDCAKKVARKMARDKSVNKIKSYQQKLTSAIIFKDYDRVCQILLQLSNYSEVPFDFAYALFEDFEGNKDIAYTFINGLRLESDSNTKEEGGKEA